MTTLQDAIASALTAAGHNAFLGTVDEVARVAAEACDVWRATTPLDMPYEETTEPVLISAGDLVIADQVTARAAVSPDLPALGRLPLLILTFNQSRPTGSTRVAEVGVLLDVVGMRKVGKNLRDAAFGAANAAERLTEKRQGHR